MKENYNDIKYSILKLKVKKIYSALWRPNLLVVAGVSVLIRGSSRCGESDSNIVFSII
jgi:hypothetical protein